jgi:hypothetical protein
MYAVFENMLESILAHERVEDFGSSFQAAHRASSHARVSQRDV